MNVKYYCEECHHTVFAPGGEEPPCRENRGDACVMEQVEGEEASKKAIAAEAERYSVDRPEPKKSDSHKKVTK